jgi:hypothetical protein
MATVLITAYNNSDKYTIMDPVTSLTSSFIDVSAKETELTAGVESALHAKCSEGSSYAPYASSNQQDELAWSSSTLLDQLDPWSKGFLSLVNEHMCNFSEGSVSPAGQLSELAIEGSYLDKAKIKYEHSNSDNELVSLLLYVYLTEN